MAVVMGVDIGQQRDPTAVAVVESERRAAAGRPETHFLVRHLERLALGTPYPAVIDRISQVAAAVVERTGRAPRVYLDATGVGTPVVNSLRAAGLKHLVAVYFTAGDRRVVKGSEVGLGKAWLVSRLQALLQFGRLHLPKTAEAEALAGELLDYEIRVSENGNDTYGAFRVGTHDDLVTALGLAVQEEQADVASALPVLVPRRSGVPGRWGRI